MKTKLNIDKLEIAFNANQDMKDYLENSNGLNSDLFILVKRMNKSTNYKNYFDIYMSDNTLFGSLYFGSFNLNRQQLYIHVNNQILYSNNLCLLYAIMEILKLEFSSICRLDIALDFNINVVNKFYKLLKNKELEFIILNKNYSMADEISHLLNIAKGTRNNVYKNKSFYIQNREGGLTLSAYNKLKEIEDNNNEKQYIKDLFNYKMIYRYEIRTTHNILVDTLINIGYTDEYLFQILINRDNDELFVLYLNLLNRIIRIRYKNKTYSLLEFIH